jgi:hypothetical protein
MQGKTYKIRGFLKIARFAEKAAESHSEA